MPSTTWKRALGDSAKYSESTRTHDQAWLDAQARAHVPDRSFPSNQIRRTRDLSPILSRARLPVAVATITVDAYSAPVQPLPGLPLGICQVAFHGSARFSFLPFSVSRGFHGSISVATMGRSEPPFLYDRPHTYNFDGPIDRGFNPKAVTQASRTPASPRARPRPEGPMITFNRHPDTVRTVTPCDIYY